MRVLLALPLVALCLSLGEARVMHDAFQAMVAPSGGNNIYCPVCRMLVQAVEQKLNSLATADEQEVEQLLDNALCSQLGPLKETCIKLVAQYVPEIIADLQKGEKNIDICAIIKLCPSNTMELAAGGGIFCQKCQEFVKEAEQMINNLLNANEAQIEQILDNAICSRMGPLKDTCVNVIKMYIPKIVAALEKGEQINICAIIKLCDAQMAFAQSEMEQLQSGIFCQKCQELVKEAEQMINNLLNGDQGQIEQILDNAICSRLGPLKATCDNLIKMYIPKIIAALEKGEKINICEIIKLCNAQISQVAQIEEHLVLVEPAQFQGGLFCAKCQEFVHQAEQMLNNLLNANEQQVENILDKEVCAKMGPLKDYCISAIEKYIPVIVAIIEKGEGNINICALIKLCQEQVAMEAMQPAQFQGGLFCAKCQEFVHQAEQMLNNLLNANEQQVEDILDKEVCAKMGPLKDYCISAIKKYIPVIVAIIEKGEGNINICAIIKLCQEQMAMEAMQATVDLEGGLFCDKCQEFVKKAEQMLNNLLNANEQNVEEILDKEVCAKLGFLKNYCMNAIKQYIPVIVKILQNEEGNINICALIKLCPQGTVMDAVFMQQPGFGCDICQAAWKSIEGFVKDELQKLEVPIEQKIDVLCNEVGKIVPFLKKTCELAVQDLVPDVVQWLDGELDHLPFCQDIHVC